MSDQLKLIHEMMRKMASTFNQMVQMFDQFMKVKQIEGERKGKTLQSLQALTLKANRHKSPIKFDNLLFLEKSKAKDRPSRESSKEMFSFRQRIAALKSIGKHIEEEGQKSKPKQKRQKQNSAFFTFLKEKKESIKKQYPQLNNSQIMKILSDVWKTMSKQEKQPFEKENVETRINFDKQFEKYFQKIDEIQKNNEAERSE